MAHASCRISRMPPSGKNQLLSAKHPKKLKEMVEKAAQWSETHHEPLWFHAAFEGNDWYADKMPHFEETFKLE